ncbi:MAG TPA: STAUR_1299 family protein [Thermoanaerobaculia bacterium]|nr:STAUR_1299 family protein [Thermoanaerobaculia bacterium]
MEDFRKAVIAKAFREIPAETYNRVLADLTAGAWPPLVYEVAVPEAGPWEGFRDAAYPPFARYLKSKRIDPEDPRGVVVSAFLGSRCFLLEAPAFLGILREMDGLNASALHFRVLRWLG